MQKIQFKYITEEGKYKCKTHEITIPIFENYDTEFKGVKFQVTKESQIMDFLDEMDKTEFMQENDIVTILDYKPFIPKMKINKEFEILSIFKDAISANENKEQMFFDFVAVATKMRYSIKNLSIDKQLNLILNGLNIGYKAQSEVVKELLDYSKNLDKNLSELKTHDKRLNYLKSKEENKQLSE